MPKVFTEERLVKSSTPMFSDIARHLYTRFSLGETIILSSNPRYFLPNFKKEWLKLERIIRRERASTLDSKLIQKLTYTADAIHALRFSYDFEKTDAAVYILEFPNTLDRLSSSHTVYVTEPMDDANYKSMLRLMPDYSVVVTYKNKDRL